MNVSLPEISIFIVDGKEQVATDLRTRSEQRISRDSLNYARFGSPLEALDHR